MSVKQAKPPCVLIDMSITISAENWLQWKAASRWQKAKVIFKLAFTDKLFRVAP